MNQTFRIEHEYIFLKRTQCMVHFGTRNGGSTGTIHYNFSRFNIFSDNFQRVEQSGGTNNGRSMLIVVHDRNIQLLLESLFNFEAFRSRNILQINSTESRFQNFDRSNELVHIFCIQFDIKNINIGINFK